MSIKKLSKDGFDSLVTGLIGSEQDVVGIQQRGEAFSFGPLESAADLRLDYDVSLLPPKKYFQPQIETLVKYEIGGGYESVYDDRKMILIGVHPYDLIAIGQMDRIFSEGEPDSHYLRRRANITIVAVDVAEASKNTFASEMGTAVAKEGYDVLITDIGDGYIVDAATAKGEAILAGAKDAAEATEQDLAKRSDIQEQNKTGLCNHKLDCDLSELPALLDEAYDHPVWEEKAKTCFSCGSCNLVCPTCYCFDVQDDVDWSLETGKRCRAWDGCLLEGFSLVAGNHNFRKDRAGRFRHRIYRKAKFVPSKIGGEIACVGCGRCVTACVPDIANPVSGFNRLAEDIKVK